MSVQPKQESNPAHTEKRPRAAGGWGSVSTLTNILTQEQVPVLGSEILWKQNKPDGFMCVSCSWAKPAEPHKFEFCENGAKATAWEITEKKTKPEFFAEHTVSELRGWSDHALEEHGRLTHPLRYDATSDKYLPVSWDEAFKEIGAELNKLDPKSVIMYTSGRASLEASYMYQLFGRMYGTNNFPDSSNMCHEFDFRRPAARDRRAGRHRAAARFRQDRMHFLLRPQHHHQRAAHAASPATRGPARRADRHLQSAA